jgi:hypothetical protein
MRAVGRFDDVRRVLRGDAVLVSGRGAAANEMVNRADRLVAVHPRLRQTNERDAAVNV